MNKILKWGFVGLLVAAAAMTVVYRAVNRVPSSELPLNEQVYEIFTDGAAVGEMKTNMSGKLSLSVELQDGKDVDVKIVRK